MKRRKHLVCLLLLLVTVLSIQDRVSACACCAEQGEYRISLSKPRAFEFTLLRNMRFGNTAHLFTTAAGVEEDAKGVSNPSEKYTLIASFVNDVWKLTFRDGNKTGSLNLPIPPKMLSYRVDIHTTPGSVDPTLYKEWRFEGRVSGTGIFSAGIVGPTKYFLVFQGRGNNCDSETDFTHWRLEVTGRKARYAFYGEFQKATAVTKQAKGTFEVKMNPQAAEENVGDATIGRMSIEKQIHGDLEATSKGQMLASMPDALGSGAYVAIERVNGTLNGHKGTFALHHRGVMNRGAPQLTISVVPDSGTGDLVGLEGTMTIEIVDGKHFYEFEYTIAKPK